MIGLDDPYEAIWAQPLAHSPLPLVEHRTSLCQRGTTEGECDDNSRWKHIENKIWEIKNDPFVLTSRLNRTKDNCYQLKGFLTSGMKIGKEDGVVVVVQLGIMGTLLLPLHSGQMLCMLVYIPMLAVVLSFQEILHKGLQVGVFKIGCRVDQDPEFRIPDFSDT